MKTMSKNFVICTMCAITWIIPRAETYADTGNPGVQINRETAKQTNKLFQKFIDEQSVANLACCSSNVEGFVGPTMESNDVRNRLTELAEAVRDARTRGQFEQFYYDNYLHPDKYRVWTKDKKTAGKFAAKIIVNGGFFALEGYLATATPGGIFVARVLDAQRIMFNKGVNKTVNDFRDFAMEATDEQLAERYMTEFRNSLADELSRADSDNLNRVAEEKIKGIEQWLENENLAPQAKNAILNKLLEITSQEKERSRAASAGPQYRGPSATNDNNNNNNDDTLPDETAATALASALRPQLDKMNEIANADLIEASAEMRQQMATAQQPFVGQQIKPPVFSLPSAETVDQYVRTAQRYLALMDQTLDGLEVLNVPVGRDARRAVSVATKLANAASIANQAPPYSYAFAAIAAVGAFKKPQPDLFPVAVMDRFDQVDLQLQNIANMIQETERRLAFGQEQLFNLMTHSTRTILNSVDTLSQNWLNARKIDKLDELLLLNNTRMITEQKISKCYTLVEYGNEYASMLSEYQDVEELSKEEKSQIFSEIALNIRPEQVSECVDELTELLAVWNLRRNSFSFFHFLNSPKVIEFVQEEGLTGSALKFDTLPTVVQQHMFYYYGPYFDIYHKMLEAYKGSLLERSHEVELETLKGNLLVMNAYNSGQARFFGERIFPAESLCKSDKLGIGGKFCSDDGTRRVEDIDSWHQQLLQFDGDGNAYDVADVAVLLYRLVRLRLLQSRLSTDSASVGVGGLVEGNRIRADLFLAYKAIDTAASAIQLALAQDSLINGGYTAFTMLNDYSKFFVPYKRSFNQLWPPLDMLNASELIGETSTDPTDSVFAENASLLGDLRIVELRDVKKGKDGRTDYFEFDEEVIGLLKAHGILGSNIMLSALREGYKWSVCDGKIAEDGGLCNRGNIYRLLSEATEDSDLLRRVVKTAFGFDVATRWHSDTDGQGYLGVVLPWDDNRTIKLPEWEHFRYGIVYSSRNRHGLMTALHELENERFAIMAVLEYILDGDSSKIAVRLAEIKWMMSGFDQ